MDGGGSFAEPTRVTDEASDIRVGPPGRVAQGVSFGDFLGVASLPDATLTSWTDSRRGNEATGKQDVYFAEVPSPG